MSTDEAMPDDVYKYNVRPVIKPEYFEESLWMLIKNADDAKAAYDWQGDEIVVCSHPRSGTHMTWQLIRYMLQGNTNKPSDAMTESVYPCYFYPNGTPQTGPRRVLCSHLLPCQFPDPLMKTGNRKFIYTLRNPNDCAVSTFNMWSDMIGTKLPKEFPVYYNEFITATSTCFPCTGWYNHIKAWEEYTARNPDVPIMLQMYEDLVRKPRESLKRIARFLDIEVTEEFLNELVEASKFSNMRKTKVDEGTNEMFHGDANATVFRKGVIGDWKNWLTVQNYELFQKVFPQLSDDMACKDKLIFT